MRKEAGETAQALVELYESRHAAEPGRGYDKKAAEWRERLAQPDSEGEPAPTDK